MSGTSLANKPHLYLGEEIEYPDSVAASSIVDEDTRGCNHQSSRLGGFRLSRLLSAMNPRRRNNDLAYEYHAAPTEDMSDESHKIQIPRQSFRKPSRRRLLKRICFYLPIAILALLGLLHVLMVVLGRKSLFWDVEEYEQFLPDWGLPGHTGDGLAHYPTDATRDIQPIPCHSHNDYWRRVPLFDAIHAGCISVEADVWLFKDREDLYVGHDTASLSPERTFASLYISPVVELLDKMLVIGNII